MVPIDFRFRPVPARYCLAVHFSFSIEESPRSLKYALPTVFVFHIEVCGAPNLSIFLNPFFSLRIPPHLRFSGCNIYAACFKIPHCLYGLLSYSCSVFVWVYFYQNAKKNCQFLLFMQYFLSPFLLLLLFHNSFFISNI